MHDNAMLVLTIIGAVITWTVSVISGAIWLSSKFNELRHLIYREMEMRRRVVDRALFNVETRVQRLEIHAFGVTYHGAPPEPPDVEPTP